MNKIINLTNINFTVGNNRKILFIVLHYVGQKSTAINNGIHFKDVDHQASAHYFVDEINCVQVVEDKNVSWHCGTTGIYKHAICRNSNSIGIEMCCNRDANGNLFIEQLTIDNTIELIKELMVKYNIPVENIVRHYDVTGKLCPAPYVNEQNWAEFKSKLIDQKVVPIEQIKSLFQSYQVQVTATPNLRKREQPNTNSKILGNYPTNSIVTIVDKYNNWGKDLNGTWICLDYTRPYTTFIELQKRWYARYKTKNKMNVRTNPDINSKILKVYPIGINFDIYEEINGWGHSPSGWIYLPYCIKLR
jgi:N-acetylmuramoyl-L-alanine amidase CwlA